MIAAHLLYEDALSMKRTCRAMYRVLDIPTAESFWKDPKWYLREPTAAARLVSRCHTRRVLPCHLCRRLLHNRAFAANQCDRGTHGQWKLSNFPNPSWCLECGFKAGFYTKGQVVRHWCYCAGCFCEDCGNFVAFFDYCELGVLCNSCAWRPEDGPVGEAPDPREHNKRCKECREKPSSMLGLISGPWKRF